MHFGANNKLASESKSFYVKGGESKLGYILGIAFVIVLIYVFK